MFGFPLEVIKDEYTYEVNLWKIVIPYEPYDRAVNRIP